VIVLYCFLSSFAACGLAFALWKFREFAISVRTDNSNALMIIEACDKESSARIALLEKSTAEKLEEMFRKFDDRLKLIEEKPQQRQVPEEEQVTKFTTARALRAHLGGIQ
jgi:hypothetical protein